MQAATLPPFGAAEPPAAATLLDEREEWERFSRPLAPDGGRWESYLAVEGMHCPGCALTIEEALTPLAGVHAVTVNGATAIARLEWDPQRGRPSEWLAALSRAGYRGLPAGDQLGANERRAAARRMLWRWLVAGFCMMQVMMYATPAYLAEPGEMTADVASLLRWAGGLLTLPVLLFSCQPFFSAAWRDLRHGRLGMDVPVTLGILVASGASAVSTFEPQGVFGGEVWWDSVTMFVFFLLSGRMLEHWLRDRTAGALEALMRRLPELAQRLREDGSVESVPVRRLRPGDRVQVRAGETVPADGVVLEGTSRVDEALLTGESTPLARGQGDAVVAGSHNLAGTLIVEVRRVGPDTRYGEIVALMERAAAEKPRLARLADRIAAPFLGAVLVAAAAAALWWWPQGPAHALGIAVAVLIVTCPCALSLAAPVATLAGAGALARRGVLVRRLEAMEQAAGVDAVVFDKTGTLTLDQLAVREIKTREGIDAQEVLRCAAALAAHTLHPAARAVALAANEATVPAARAVQEHPGQGVEGLVARAEGAAPERMRLGAASFCGAAPSAGAAVHLADEAGWLATFALHETLKAGAQPAVDALRRMHVDVAVLSGDGEDAVRLLAARTGVAEAHARQSPGDKLRHVRELQASGRRVAMVGDGMNDGPVLARADVSIAMGEGVPVAQARSDFIILGGRVEAVAWVLRHARRTQRVVRQNLAWAAAYNAICVPLALAGAMPAWLAGLGMAASSLLVVANAARLATLSEA